MALDRTKTQQNADKLARQGKIDQAIAEYEKILAEYPRDMNLKNKVGDLLHRAGNVPDAVKVYNQVASFYAEEGFYLKAIAIYKKVNRLDPASIACYYNLAELYSKQGLTNDAKSQYLQVADLYVKEGDFTKAGQALEQYLKLDPDNYKIRMRLAEFYTKLGQSAKALSEYQTFGDELSRKGQFEEAIRFYERGLGVDDSHAGLVSGLVRALGELGRHDQVIDKGRHLYSRNRDNVDLLTALATAYEKSGQPDLARQAYDKLAALEPDNPTWKRRQEAAEAAPPGGPIPDFSELTGDYSMEELGEASGEFGPEGALDTGAGESSGALETERDEFIVEHTTEAEVFIKYGLVEKAIDNLEAIVNHYPDEVESLRRLKDLYLETGNKSRAAEKCVDLARIARQRGEVDRALEMLAEARAHDPAVQVDRAAALAAAAGFETEREVPVELEGGPPSAGVELDFGPGGGGGLEFGAASEAVESIEFSLEEGAEEPAGIELDFESPSGEAAAAGQAAEADEGIEFFDEAIRAPQREEAAPLGGDEPAAGVEEADDSLFDQEDGFLSKAGGAEPKAAERPPEQQTIGEESLEEILKEFKKGVEAQLDAEDYETHYNLGIAYKDMDLWDEAIAEFQLAAKDPAHLIESCSHLGQCFRVKGMPKLAVKWYARALEALDPESPQYTAIKYDLGEAYQESGDRDKALAEFIDVLGLDAGFRDVADKVASLGDEE